MWFGFGLVLIGVLLLLNNLGIIQGNAWGYVWPIIIIVIGFSILLKRRGIKVSPKDESDIEAEEITKSEK